MNMAKNFVATNVIPFIALACLVGCESRRGGRIDIYEDSPAALGGQEMPLRDLVEAADVVAEALIADINRLSDQDWGGYRVNLVLGDFQNKTRKMRSDDFELMQNRIKNSLMSSRLFRDNVKVFSDLTRIEDLNSQQGIGGRGDPMQERVTEPGASAALNPQYTFHLNGDAYGAHRGPVHYYYIALTLVRASDREQVFSKDYEMKFQQHR